MNEEEIRDLYDRLIAHYAESHRLPKLTEWKPSLVILDKDAEGSQFYEKSGNANALGAWSYSLWTDSIDEDTIQGPCIEFYGEPSIGTVMHELIHHIIHVIDRCETIDEEALWKPEDLAHTDEWPF